MLASRNAWICSPSPEKRGTADRSVSTMVPLVTIVLTLLSAVPLFSGLGEQIHAFLLANMLPDTAGKVVSGYIEQFTGRAGRLTALGTGFLAVTAFLMMFTI